MTFERAALLGLWGFAVLACVLGLAAAPGTHEGLAGRAVDVAHLAGTTALAITLVLGPGIVLRAQRGVRLGLGFLPLPGLGLLVVTALVAWALADVVEPWLVCLLVLGPVLAWMPLGVLRAGATELLEPEERRALLMVGCVLGLAVAKALWSISPVGELFAGTISRTLEVGGRSDSRIPFHVVQLVANGTGPFSELGASYFSPFDFSSRGPLAGLASAPIVLSAGGRPPTTMPDQPWTPFDPQGFMAFRIAVMTFACTAFLSLWTLIRSLGGQRAARFGLLLAATTPFLVHEVWFTWPKLLAASFVLLAAVSLIAGHPLRAGLLAGIGYLVHPGALLFIPVLCAIALWPLVGARLRVPRLKPAALVLVGALICLVAWRLVNGSHYTQSDFFDYLTLAGYGEPATFENWLSSRLESVRNTLVPLTPFFLTDDLDTNVVRDTSPKVIYFFFQYWIALPFGIGIVFFPLLLVGIWKAARRWTWAVFVTIVVPLLAFGIYWPFREGLLRENLQAWVLALIAVIALEQRQEGFAWLRSRLIRAVLALRAMEVLAVAVVPVFATSHLAYASCPQLDCIIHPQFEATDALALIAMFAFSGALAAFAWFERPPPPAPARSTTT
jgi:hypothetical protein